jgi:hypothetical protein
MKAADPKVDFWDTPCCSVPFRVSDSLKNDLTFWDSGTRQSTNMLSDANHQIGQICSRYGCGHVSVVDTQMGAMCHEHSFPLLFPIQLFLYEGFGLPPFVAWELVRPHDRQAIENHGQTLARLAERAGLSPKELLAVITRKPYWSEIDRLSRQQVADRLLSLIAEWQRSPSTSPR